MTDHIVGLAASIINNLSFLTSLNVLDLFVVFPKLNLGIQQILNGISLAWVGRGTDLNLPKAVLSVYTVYDQLGRCRGDIIFQLLIAACHKDNCQTGEQYLMYSWGHGVQTEFL